MNTLGSCFLGDNVPSGMQGPTQHCCQYDEIILQWHQTQQTPVAGWGSKNLHFEKTPGDSWANQTPGVYDVAGEVHAGEEASQGRDPAYSQFCPR